MTRLPRRLPLRWRLVTAAVAAGAGFAVLFGFAAVWRLDQLEDNALTSSLRSQLQLVRPDLSPNGVLTTPGGRVPKSTLAQVVGPNGKVRDSSPALARVVPLVGVRQVYRAGPGGVRASVGLARPDVDIALLAVPVTVTAAGPGQPAGRAALVVGISSEGFLAARDQLAGLLEVGLPIVVVVIGALTWLLSGRALRTVTRLTEEAEAVSVSDIGRGLVVPAHDEELARLARALNRLLARVGDSLDRQRVFSAEASHRLRTPLALLRAEAELALAAGGEREMRRALRQVTADADNLSQLLDRVLSFATDPGTRAGSAPLEEVVEAAASRWRRQVEAAGLALDVRIDAAGEVEEYLLRSGVEPLVENAVQHTPAGGRIEVHFERGDTNVITATVTDTGAGVDPTVRDSLFEARVTTRAEQGGVGLGLWLARDTLRAAGGDLILVDSTAGHTCFRAQIPVQTRQPDLADADRLAPTGRGIDRLPA